MHRNWRTSVATLCLIVSGVCSGPGSASAELNDAPLTGPAFAAADQAYRAIAAGQLGQALDYARQAAAAAPESEAAARLLIDVLTRVGKRGEALQVANRAIASGGAGAGLYAQRGYLLTGAANADAAADDFAAALKAGGLDAEQEANVRTALQNSRFLARASAAYAAAAQKQYSKALRLARLARVIRPRDDGMARLVVQALARLGRVKEALQEADKALSSSIGGAALRVQRGQQRQAMGDLTGAEQDFSKALEDGTLPRAQSAGVQSLLSEVRFTRLATQAYAALAKDDQETALALSQAASKIKPGDEGMVRVTIQALSELGRTDEALREADRAIASQGPSAALFAQRGYLRRADENLSGAIEDFAAAIEANRRNNDASGRLPYALAEARSALARGQGNFPESATIWRNYLAGSPDDAEAWFALGSDLASTGQTDEAVRALEEGLRYDARGSQLLLAGRLYAKVDARKSSTYLRRAIDARDAGDTSLAGLTAREWEQIRNQTTFSDQSIRTTINLGFGTGRSIEDGGDSALGAAETAVRFDGRYLPYVEGLEAYARGAISRDGTDFQESAIAAGLRWRPFEELNFSVSGELQHRIDPSKLDQLVLGFGYSQGGIPYPYDVGWEPFQTVGVFGSLRLGEERALASAAGAFGIAFKGRSPLRYVLAPSLAFETSYDSASTEPVAVGAGPALDFATWIGGDRYRSYDATASLTLKYLVPLSKSERLSGLRLDLRFQF